MLRLNRLFSLGRGLKVRQNLDPLLTGARPRPILQARQTTSVIQAQNISSVGAAEKKITSIPPKEVKHQTKPTDDTILKGLHEGLEIEGFVVQQISKVPDFHLTAVRLLHSATGAQYLHVHREDSNNAFSIGFRTTPDNSTGLPHILEHTTLCGSQKYPCRDPFFKMLNRSMATFMNAMTGPDYTMYPFSTQNPRDYKNLMSVYLDAVFKPKLEESDFRQEGWRLEHEDPNDASSPIIFKGVVFNEMKGAFSENQSLFGQELLNSILPGHTYGVVSGGDPLVIPSLTYEDLKAFHRTYYSPPNSRFYSYGNFPLADHLKYVNSNYLIDSKVPPDSGKLTAVPLEKRWTAEKRKHIPCRPDPMAADAQKQSSLAVGYLCSDINDVEETFVLQVMSELLVKGPNSAFYKSLVEPNIGAGFSPVTGYDAHTRDTIFTVGLQGLSAADFEKVDCIIQETFDKVIENGFDKQHIEGILHGIELNTKHQSTDFGLGLLFGLTPLWNHDGDLVKSLQIGELVTSLRQNLANNPKYLQDKVVKHFKNNPHRLVLTMSPEEDYEAKQAHAEKDILNAKIAKLTKDDMDYIYDEGLRLAEKQQQTEDTSCLPTLKTADLKQDLERTTTETVTMSSIPVQLCSQPTNGITYFRGILNTSTLDDELKMLLPLFNQIASKMGTKSHDYREFDQLIRLKTGGLGISTHIAEDIQDMSKYEEGLMFYTYCLDRNIQDMFSIWSELFSSVTLNDLKRFDTLVRVIAAELVNGVADMGHHYAMSSAAALVNPAARRKELSGGLSHIAKMKQLAQMTDLQPILGQMQEISRHLFNKNHLRCSVNLCPESLPVVLQETECFIQNLPGSTQQSFLQTESDEMPAPKSVHHIVPIPVNFAAKSISTVPYNHPHFASLRIMSRLITSKYLHPNVREKGGAYGSGASLSTAGILNFYSYRDPNTTATFDIFDKSKDWISDDKFTDQDIEEAKLGVFQSVDAPVPPGSRGLVKFLYGMDDDLRQSHRVALKKVGREDIHEVACQYLATESSKCGRALIGPENPALLTREEENWEVIVQET